MLEFLLIEIKEYNNYINLSYKKEFEMIESIDNPKSQNIRNLKTKNEFLYRLSKFFHKLFNNLEISQKSFWSLLILLFGLISIIYSNVVMLSSFRDMVYYFSYEKIYNGFLIGIGIWIVLAFLIIDLNFRKYLIISILCFVYPFLCLVTRYEAFWRNSTYQILFFSYTSLLIFFILNCIFVYFSQETSTLEKGRISAILFILTGLFTMIIDFVYRMLKLEFMNIIFFPFIVGLFLLFTRNNEKTFLHSSIVDVKKKIIDKAFTKEKLGESTEKLNNYQKFVDKYNIFKKKKVELLKKKANFKEFLKFIYKNKKINTYFLIFLLFGFILGLVLTILNQTTFTGNFFYVYFPHIIGSLLIYGIIIAFVLGFIFDYYGRKSIISAIIFVITILIGLNMMRTNEEVESNMYEYFILMIILFFQIIILISGDLGERPYTGRIFLVNIAILIIGFLISLEIGAYLIEKMLDINQISILIIFVCTSVLFIFSFVKIDGLSDEQKWKSSLKSLFIVHRSGLTIYNTKFEKGNLISTDLVGGGFIGVISILKEITRGRQKLRIIDHGDKKILFQWNENETALFVLIIDQDLAIIREKLLILEEQFSSKFDISEIDRYGVDVSKYCETKDIVDQIFNIKY